MGLYNDDNDEIMIMLILAAVEEAKKEKEIQAMANLRDLLLKDFPFGLRLNELYGAYEVSSETNVPARVCSSACKC